MQIPLCEHALVDGMNENNGSSKFMFQLKRNIQKSARKHERIVSREF